MKVTLDIPDSSQAVNVVVLFGDDSENMTFSTGSFKPVDGMVIQRRIFDSSSEEVLPDART